MATLQEQVYQCHFSNICSVCVSVTHFAILAKLFLYVCVAAKTSQACVLTGWAARDSMLGSEGISEFKQRGSSCVHPGGDLWWHLLGTTAFWADTPDVLVGTLWYLYFITFSLKMYKLSIPENMLPAEHRLVVLTNSFFCNYEEESCNFTVMQIVPFWRNFNRCMLEK